MKTTKTLSALAALLAATTTTAGTVTVELTGVEARGGTLYAALQKKGEFMGQAGLSAKVERPAAGTVRLTFPDVPAGEYALSALHDANGDKRMNLSEANLPLEGWAMSRGETLRKSPLFDDVKVTVPASDTTLRAAFVYQDGKAPAR